MFTLISIVVYRSSPKTHAEEGWQALYRESAWAFAPWICAKPNIISWELAHTCNMHDAGGRPGV